MLQGFAGLQQGFLIYDAAAARQVILTRVRDLQGPQVGHERQPFAPSKSMD